MATAKATVYPYVVMTLKGEFSHLGHNSWPGEDNISGNFIYLYLPSVEIEVEVPDEAALRAAGVKLIDAKKQAERAKFMAQQTLLESIKNDLLRLEAPEVLDAVDKRGSTAKDMMRHMSERDQDDDIPF